MVGGVVALRDVLSRRNRPTPSLIYWQIEAALGAIVRASQTCTTYARRDQRVCEQVCVLWKKIRPVRQCKTNNSNRDRRRSIYRHLYLIEQPWHARLALIAGLGVSINRA